MRPIMTVLLAFLALPVAAESHVERVRAAGSLILLCFPQQDNEFIFVRTEAGPMPEIGDARHFGGIDVEILEHVARELGVALRIRPITEPNIGLIFKQLEGGEADIAAGSLTITEARRQRVAFSEPYVPVYEAVIVREGSELRGPKDLKGKRAALMEGSSHYEVMKRRGLPDESIVPVEFTIGGLVAVQDGEAHYTLVDAYGTEAEVALPRGLEKAFVLPGEVGGIGMALPRGSDLVTVVDRVIAKLRTSGELDAIIDRHKRW